MRDGLSIGGRLTAYVGSLLTLVLIVGSVATVTASRLDRSARAIDGTWFAGARVLDALSDEVAQFRFAEIDRALARAAGGDPAPAVDQEQAAAHRAAVDRLVDAFRGTVGSDVPGLDAAAFSGAWQDYLIVHDAWLRADVYRHATGIARLRSSLDWRYKSVDSALVSLKAARYRAAGEEIGRATRLAAGLNWAVSICFAVATVVALLVFVDVSRRIVGPLKSMTAALARLADGNLGLAIPEMHRDDEIGLLAKAFEVFRANAAELEAAHARARKAQEQAHALARQDALTGLPNRRVFASELGASVDRARETGSGCALLLVDLDRFKPINDVRGHGVGDLVLCEVARRLAAAAAGGGKVSRLGGDEFAVIVEAAPADVRDEAARTAQDILVALRAPLTVDGLGLEIGASVGIACWLGAKTQDDLVREADLAMYKAKREGRDRFRFFEAEMDEVWRDRITLDDDLGRAILDGQIEPHYQPVVELGTGRVCGFEVLARWTHPKRGPIPPDRFVAMAERLGLVPELTSRILRRACRDALGWGGRPRLAVNVSPCEIVDRSFPGTVLAILDEVGYPPSLLEIEVTESALVDDVAAAKSVLAALQEHGILVSLDDFGTGYSSLYHLRHLRFDKIKVDKSFVQSLHTDSESAKIVDAVLGLARSLGMPVVAEGIEDAAAMAFLAERGCEYGQGYLFGRAVPAGEAGAILGRQAERGSAAGPPVPHERPSGEPHPPVEVEPPSEPAVA